MKQQLQLTDSLAPVLGADSLTLFPVSGDLGSWERDPLKSFEDWLSQKKMSLNSAKVYSFMWGKFSRWRESHHLDMAHVRSTHIEHFLDDAGLTKHHRYRYVRLIERVYQHLALVNPGLGNPGSQAARQKVGEGHNSPMAYLLEDQKNALVQWIVRDLSGEEYARKDEPWKEKRDLAIAAAMLGGGIKVGEARGLSVSCISGDGAWLTVDGVGEPDHKTCLLPFARPVVQQWIEQRASMKLPGDWLFVAGENGRQMDAATIYRRVQRVMERSGISMDAREGPQTLRNAFISTLFDLGVPDGVLTGYLGLRESSSVDRLRGRLRDAMRQA